MPCFGYSWGSDDFWYLTGIPTDLEGWGGLFGEVLIFLDTQTKHTFFLLTGVPTDLSDFLLLFLSWFFLVWCCSVVFVGDKKEPRSKLVLLLLQKQAIRQSVRKPESSCFFRLWECRLAEKFFLRSGQVLQPTCWRPCLGEEWQDKLYARWSWA